MTTTYTPKPTLDWNWDNDYNLAYAETDDPRVLAVIQRDEYPSAPDYDAQAPTLMAYDYGSRANFTQIGGKSDAPDGWLRARQQWQDDDLADRFVRIFYGVRAVHHLSSSIDRYSWGLVFDADDWRTDMGIEPTTELDRDNLCSEVDAYFDGAVYAVGYAVSHTRTTTEIPVDLDDPDQGWDTTLECWGFYGEDYAKESAEAFDHGGPDLDLMLDHTDPAVIAA